MMTCSTSVTNVTPLGSSNWIITYNNFPDTVVCDGVSLTFPPTRGNFRVISRIHHNDLTSVAYYFVPVSNCVYHTGTATDQQRIFTCDPGVNDLVSYRVIEVSDSRLPFTIQLVNGNIYSTASYVTVEVHQFPNDV